MIRRSAAVLTSILIVWAACSALAQQAKIDAWDTISITWGARVGGTKMAILIANSAYQHVKPLPGPPQDVKAMASQLSQLGFETKILQNPSAFEIVQTIVASKAKGGRGSLLALYYSGHAAEVDGENSLLLTGYDPA